MRHSRTVLLCALFCLAALPLFAGELPAEPAANDLPQVEVTLEDLLTPAVDVEGACDAPTADAQPASSCPYNLPECQEHDDCDDFCGDPAFGNCERQGFFPFGCCYCLG